MRGFLKGFEKAIGFKTTVDMSADTLKALKEVSKRLPEAARSIERASAGVPEAARSIERAAANLPKEIGVKLPEINMKRFLPAIFGGSAAIGLGVGGGAALGKRMFERPPGAEKKAFSLFGNQTGPSTPAPKPPAPAVSAGPKMNPSGVRSLKKAFGG